MDGAIKVRAGLAASARNRDLGDEDSLTAEHAWEEFWAATRPVELTLAVEQQVGQLAKSHALRGAVAVHMASALAINDPDLVVPVWGRRLHVGVLAAGGRVAPANLDADIHRAERSASPVDIGKRRCTWADYAAYC
jgi:uncharacterized protein